MVANAVIITNASMIITLGLIKIPVANLQKPPRESRLLHKPDQTFVRNLKIIW